MKKFKTFREDTAGVPTNTAGSGAIATYDPLLRKNKVRRRKYKLLNMSVNEGALDRFKRFIVRELIGGTLFGKGSGAYNAIARSKYGYAGPTRGKKGKAILPAGNPLYRVRSLNKRLPKYFMGHSKDKDTSELSRDYNKEMHNRLSKGVRMTKEKKKK